MILNRSEPKPSELPPLDRSITSPPRLVVASDTAFGRVNVDAWGKP